MTTRSEVSGSISRRGFLGGAAAAGSVAFLARYSPAATSLAGGADAPAAGVPAAGAKPNSVINGVRIGCITYSYRGGINFQGGITSAEDTLKALIQDGLSVVELMDGPIRAYTGIGGGRGLGGGRGPGGGRGQSGAAGQPPAQQPAQPPAPLTDAQRAEQREKQLAKCRDMRKMYNDAGVNIHAHKIGFGETDQDIDFNFEVAKALGCVAITTERNEALARRLAPFADKHKIWVAFHNHTNNVPVIDKPDPILAFGDHIGFNLDIGHYFAGTKGQSPIPVIEKYHDRIISLHLKDRTADGRNLSWGKGQTPIKEVLQLLKREKWPIYADIELEYPVPKGSDSVAEVAICLQYCKEALA
jgi:sugar phosphate isomerase/epimerase